MAKKTDIPNFGPLNGVRVVHCSQSLAGPFAASLMADLGADVIWVESAVGQDVSRIAPGMAAQLDRRNMRTIKLNVNTPAGKEVLLRLVREADIFLEASKPGQYKKWGLTDEVLWGENPQLVITHISGFGQWGDPDYVRRASYDPIAQAFSGVMYMNGLPGRRSAPAEVSISDYYTGYMAAFASWPHTYPPRGRERATASTCRSTSPRSGARPAGRWTYGTTPAVPSYRARATTETSASTATCAATAGRSTWSS